MCRLGFALVSCEEAEAPGKWQAKYDERFHFLRLFYILIVTIARKPLGFPNRNCIRWDVSSFSGGRSLNLHVCVAWAQ